MRIMIAGAQHFHVLEVLKALSLMDGIDIVGVSDVAPKLEQDMTARGSRFPFFSSWREALAEKPDAVLCFDAFHHRAEIIVECLNRGISILSDKPPAITRDQLEAIFRVVNGLPRQGPHPVFSVIFSERYNPPVMTMAKLIQAGAIGSVVNFTAFRPHKLKPETRPDWMFNRLTYGGILVDLAVHDMDVFHWITGAKAVEVTAYNSNSNYPEHPELDDNAQMLFKADNGAVGFIKTEWLAPKACPTHGDCRYYVTGTRGTLEVHTEGDFHTQGGKVIICTDTQPPVSVPLEDSGPSLFEEFFARVKKAHHGIPELVAPRIGAEDIYIAVRSVLAARDAADSGRKINIEWEKNK